MKASQESGLALLLKQRRAAREIILAQRDQPLPLSLQQEALWFLAELDPESQAYTVSFALRITGRLDEDIFAKSLAVIVARHETLRSALMETDNALEQVVDPNVVARLERLDLRSSSEEDVGTQFIDFVSAKLDLRRAPLWRAALVRVGDVESRFWFVAHHAVWDGFSSGIFVRELSTIYRALAAATEPDLEPLPLQYADFAATQRHRVEGVRDVQLAYWRKRLAGASSVELPVDSIPAAAARAGKRAPTGGAHRFVVGRECADGLREIARRTGATLFHTALAGFGVLLSRWARQEDVVVAVASSTRSVPGSTKLIGCFFNTLLLRLDVTDGITFEALVRQTQATTLEALAHSDVPFASVVRTLRRAPVKGRVAPLSEIALTFIPSGGNGFDLADGVHGAFVQPPKAWDEVDPMANLELWVVEGSAGELECTFTYRASLFRRSTIERLSRHLVRLLEDVARDAEQPVGRVSLLVPEERSEILAKWSDAKTEYAPGRCIQELFEDHAARTPQEVAVVFEDQELTYGELNTRANRVAHRLRSLGVGPEVLVAVCVERSFELVVALLAVLKAGGAYVPLDPSYPKDRLAYMVSESRASILVSVGPVDIEVPGGTFLDLREAKLGQESSANLPARTRPENAAYVIFTSGSTGQPKGSVVTHHNVVRLFQATDTWFGFGATDVWTLFHSYAFDFSVWELWGALLHGGRIVVIPYLVSRSPDAFFETLSAKGVTVLNQTPSAFGQLMAADRGLPLRLRFVIFGGEALSIKSLRPWFDARGDRQPQLINMYGITETTVHVTYRPIARTDLDAVSTSVIGRPIPDLNLYILDRHLEPSPVGVPGELYVGGAGVSRGYLHRAELTAQRFVPNPFGPSGTRMYRTGDSARHLENGDVEYLGRIDLQVKIRGFRIELGEIENAIIGHSGVREALVLAREDVSGDKRLVAYVVPRSVNPQRLGETLRATLPSYMVPSAYVMLDAFPLTQNGKVDRKALPPPAIGARSGKAYVAPSSPVEELLVSVWSELLRVTRVSVDDDFFDLGGHSLLATQLVARVRRELCVELPVRAVFETPTVRTIASIIETLQKRGAEPPARFEIVRVPPGAPIPVSYSQEGLLHWAFSRPPAATWNISSGIRFTGPLDIAALERALAALVERHASLRTTFVADGSTWTQLIAPPSSPEVPVIDLRHVDSSLREEEAARLASAQAITPFEFGGEPFLRIKRIMLADDMNLLVVTAHQLIADVVSVGILTQEIGVLYAAFASGEPSPLPVLPLGFGDYAASERAWFEGDGAAVGDEVRRRLAKVKPVDLPLDRPRPAVFSHCCVGAEFHLNRTELDAMTKLCRRESVNQFMVFLAAMGALIQRRTDKPNIAIGMPMSMRGDREELRGVLGRISNLGICCFDVAEDPTISQLLGRARAAAFQTYEQSKVPASIALGTGDSLSSPLRRVMLNGPNFFGAAFAEDLPNGMRLDGYYVPFPRGVMNELTVSGWGNTESMRCLILGASDVFDEATIERMAADLRALLLQLSAGPGDRRISTLSLAPGRLSP